MTPDQWADSDEWPLPTYSGSSKVAATFYDPQDGTQDARKGQGEGSGEIERLRAVVARIEAIAQQGLDDDGRNAGWDALSAILGTLAAEPTTEAAICCGKYNDDASPWCGESCVDLEPTPPAEVVHDPHARLAPELVVLLDEWDADSENDNYSKGDAAADLRRTLRNACGCERGILPHDRRCPVRLDGMANATPPAAPQAEGGAPHDCLKNADHEPERGSFCTICDRFILLAEFS